VAARREARHQVQIACRTAELTEGPPEQRYPVSCAAVRPAVRAGFRREQAWRLVCPSAAAARKVQALRAVGPVAQPLARARQAPALAAPPMAGQAAPAGREGLQPAGELALVAPRQEAAAVPAGVEEARRRAAPDAGEGLRPVAQVVVPDAAAALRPGAQQGQGAAAAPRPEARREARHAAGVRLRAARDARAVRPSAPLSAGLPWIRFRAVPLAPSLVAGFAHKTAGSRIARRSVRWWPAAGGDGVS
jgi:hypothetical protein